MAMSGEREEYYDRLAAQSLSALWRSLSRLVTPSPASGCTAHLWPYQEVRAAALAAGSLISTHEAERRVVVLENPGLGNSQRVTSSLYGGVQLVMPGELARSHRHTQSAFRLCLEGRGGYTVVGECKVMMEPGDLVLTPGMAWHEHGNEGSEPVLWLDGLDIPIVQLLDASFAEASTPAQREWTMTSSRDYAESLLQPCAEELRTPVVHYRYEAVRRVLDEARRRDRCDPHLGFKYRYAGPRGGHVSPTLAAFLQLLPAKMQTARCRATDASVVVVREGHGASKVGDREFAWTPNDVFVVPSWTWVEHRAATDSVLFSYSDRAVQQVLELWREERLPS
jgi:gentisate 1,2-dioxygenase